MHSAPGAPASRGFDDLPDDVEALRDTLRGARARLGEVRLEPDARQATLEIEKRAL